MRAVTAERGAGSVVAPPAPQDLYRILLLRKNASELLVAGERPQFTLPCVEIPKWERVAENMNAVVGKRYGISPVCLFATNLSAIAADGEQPLYQVMETREADVAAPEGTSWLPVDSFSDQSFADEQDSLALTTTLRQIHEFENEATIGPFGKPGWIEELSSWVQDQVHPYWLCLTGEIRQLNASPTFALLRFKTNGTSLWFKAVGEPNLREFPISVTLSRLFPGFVPSVIATHPAWHGWLMTEFAGSTLDEVSDACAWERAAQTLGELQIASLGKTDQLLEAGCRDLRINSLLPLVDPFVEVMSELMSQQQKASPPTLGREELRTLGRQIKEALSELTELGIPDTLGHLDFNPGNILCSADQCIFLDWAEAYVGPPFPTFQFLIEHARQRRVGNTVCDQQLINRYNRSWFRAASPAIVASGQSVTPLTAAFFYAVALDAWHDAERLLTPRLASFFRSLTRRMQREAEESKANTSESRHRRVIGIGGAPQRNQRCP